MITKFSQYSVKHLWHFTDKTNLDTIIKHGGLLSLEKISNEDIGVSIFGGNQWSHDADRHKGLDKYITFGIC
jgi:hypothetical protein